VLLFTLPASLMDPTYSFRLPPSVELTLLLDPPHL